MPKVKTHKGASKRFKVTKNGKALRTKSLGNHKLEKKSKDNKRGKKKCLSVSSPDTKKIKTMIGA